MFSKKQVQRTSDLSFSITRMLELLLKEQRSQRSDLAFLTRLIQGMVSDKRLQRQVDEFYEDQAGEQPYETSPQTELEDK